MIALRMICSTDYVVIGRQYLARVGEEEYHVVRPIHEFMIDGANVHFRACEYYSDNGEVFMWHALYELGEIT